MGILFCLFQGRGNECSPGNSDLDVFFIYFTHSVAVSWEFFICQQDQSENESGYLVKMNKNDFIMCRRKY